jgi:uncharacterized protein (AIM24 family)
MPTQTLSEFVASQQQREDSDATFVRETPEMLEVNLDGRTLAKTGSMIAYTGDVRFQLESAFAGGFKKAALKQVMHTRVPSMNMEGKGRVYLADNEQKVAIFDLADQTMMVSGNHILAMEPGVDWDLQMYGGYKFFGASGVFNLEVRGPGCVALNTDGEPLVLQVEPGQPIYTDPDATVCWSGNLEPTVHADISIKSVYFNRSGERAQYCFEGTGWVVIQPMETGNDGMSLQTYAQPKWMKWASCLVFLLLFLGCCGLGIFL